MRRTMLSLPAGSSCVLLGFALVVTTVLAQNRNWDRFNYRGTVGNDYGPSDWIKVQCPNLDVCTGYPDKFHTSISWELGENFCQWCPEQDDGSRPCPMHQQSPINLKRNVALNYTDNDLYNPCIDWHGMYYFDSSCDWDTLVQKNAFSIERHALKVVQPLRKNSAGKWVLDCPNQVFGKVDFSAGFSDWWHLSHADLHVPSEHTQEGRRYDGELQLYHVYSVTAEEAGIHNEMASLTFFLQSYDDTEDYDTLNKLICQWREVEERTRSRCGLPSVTTTYSGCTVYQPWRRREKRNLRSENEIDGENEDSEVDSPEQEPIDRPWSAHDVIIHNYQKMHSNASAVLEQLFIPKHNAEPADPNFDWDEFIRRHSEPRDRNERHLLNYDNVEWFNYFPMIGVKTEYYHRYSGTQTVPPCYGKWYVGNDRRQINHWRVMKDPILISKRQLNELHRLLKERIAPSNDPVAACQPDTAAKTHPTDSSKVWTARPLQKTQQVHFRVFCECERWPSRWPQDQAWCKQDKMTRFYNHPYGFSTNGY